MIQKFILAQLFAAIFSVTAFAAAPARITAKEPAHVKFDIGYNEDWFGDDYLFSMIKTFDVNYVNKVFKDIKDNGGDFVRVYLFQVRQGLVINQYAPQTAGIDPKMMANIKSVLDSAKAHELKVYFTLMDANAMPAEAGELRDYYYNLIHNKYGEQDAFNNNVLTPLLGLLSQYQDTIYAIDLVNEMAAAIQHGMWGFFDQFYGPKRWMKAERDFIKSKAPWIRVSASSMSTKDVADGLYDDIGLDFYDVHIYNDQGEIPYAYELCDRVKRKGIPIIAGEFGQLSQVLDDGLQASVARNLLNNAKNWCFSGAIPWRWDAADKILHYQRPDGSLRPAVQVVKDFKAKL